MSSIAGGIDGIEAVFDDESLVADAGLLLAGTVMDRLGLVAMIDEVVRPPAAGRGSGAKALSVVASMLVGGSHIDDTDRLRAGSAQAVLPFAVAAPSTVGTWLRSFTFGHVRQLDRACELALARAWSVGASADVAEMTVDLDSTVCEVYGRCKHGAAYGHTGVLGYHPLAAVRDDTGEIIHTRMRSGSSQRGQRRFAAETLARLRRLAPAAALAVRADSGFFSYDMIDTLCAHGASYSITVPQNAKVKAAIDGICERAWKPIAYTDDGEAQVAETLITTGRRSRSRKPRKLRLVVRRTRLTGDQGELWPTGATTASSRTEPTSTPRPPTPTTVPTPESNSPSATSKTTDSPTAPRGGSSPTAPTSPAPRWPTTSPAGPPASHTPPTPDTSPSRPPSASGCSPCPDGSSTTQAATDSACPPTGPGPRTSPKPSNTPATSPCSSEGAPGARRAAAHTPKAPQTHPKPPTPAPHAPTAPAAPAPAQHQPTTPQPATPPAHRWIQA